jgi:hypothetical protein
MSFGVNRMIRLDCHGLDYIIAVAKSAGFDVIGLSSEQFELKQPEIHIHLRQSRIILDAAETTKPEPEPESEAEASEPVANGPKRDKLATLDD